LSSFMRFSVSWYSSNSPFTSTPSKSNLHTNQDSRTAWILYPLHDSLPTPWFCCCHYAAIKSGWGLAALQAVQ
jgi:hypothetical protein